MCAAWLFATCVAGCSSDNGRSRERPMAPPPSRPVSAPQGAQEAQRAAPATPPAGQPKPILAQKKLYSQNNEELVIRDFFKDRRGGFFLDVGCAWPKQHSTTYYLEKHLGWSGIGVDALSDYGPGWAKARPRSKFFALLVSDKADTKQAFYKASTTGVSSTQQDRMVMGQKVTGKEIKVQTTTLNRLLDDNKVQKVDFLSMDIEGAEPKALAGFDIERFKPELVCIEATPSIRTQVLEYFSAHGYRRLERYLKHDRVNWYFTPTG